ncbi:hypothetical protein STW0522KLE44_19570 [Klebsiella sp. STW0522-44]|jgi:hypothetical protein|nr:hypothetical protein STW0522KLE44_19570 [Klebsiella sp. STW0522-44]
MKQSYGSDYINSASVVLAVQLVLYSGTLDEVEAFDGNMNTIRYSQWFKDNTDMRLIDNN